MNQKKRYRLSLSVDQRLRDQVFLVQEQAGLTSIVETIRRAIALYALVLHEQREETEIILRRKDGVEETVRFL